MPPKCGKIYLCWKCKREFNHAGNRCRHQKDCKSGSEVLCSISGSTKTNYQCSNSWSDKKFKKYFNKERHMEVCKPKSNSEKQCFICKKIFSRMTHLRRHMESHTRKTVKRS